MTIRKEYPTQKEVRELMEYKEGKLYWKARKDSNIFNSRYAGKEVGYINPSTGYVMCKIHGETYFVHKLCFIYHYNKCPEFVDHEDGDTTSYEISNLREASSAKNSQNSSKRKDNTSGFKGVTWKASRSCWIVRVQVNGKRIERSGFKSPEEAHEAGILLREELHGKFAKHV